MAEKCFVIQPFDGGVFDKRYVDVFEPAIRDAGLIPYRVDRDPAVSIPIHEIEKAIADSAVCFAEITTDNPNVWFELGYAIASEKSVVMVCAEQRIRFPFDVQHRTIIRYKTESASDFLLLGREVIARLKGAIGRQSDLGAIAKLSRTSIAESGGLTPPEFSGLAVLAAHFSRNGYAMSGHKFHVDMERAGFNDLGSALALRGLERRGLIIGKPVEDQYDPYMGYEVTEDGMTWLEQNQATLKLTQPPMPLSSSDTDLPF